MGGRDGVGKVMRANLDLAIGFNFRSKNDRVLFVEQYLSSEGTKIGDAVFRSITEDETEPFQCLVVANYLRTAVLQDCVFKFTANPEPEKFMIGKNKHRKKPSDQMYDAYFQHDMNKMFRVKPGEANANVGIVLKDKTKKKTRNINPNNSLNMAGLRKNNFTDVNKQAVKVYPKIKIVDRYDE